MEEHLKSTRPDLGNRRCSVLLGLSAALWASPGWGQIPATDASAPTDTPTWSSASLVTSDFTLALQVPNGDSWIRLSPTGVANYLNRARCQCASPVRVLVQMVSNSRIKLTGLATTGTNARLYVGTSCLQLNAMYQPNCPNGLLGELSDLSTLATDGSWALETTVSRLFSGVGIACENTLNTTIWLWLNSTGTSSPDSNVAPCLGISLDGTPPEAPAGIAVEGSDKALVVSWAPLTTDPPDMAGYLVFCMRENGQVVFNPSPSSSAYQTSQILCSSGTPAASNTDPMSIAAENTTAVEVEAPSFFQDLDPQYLCLNLVPATQTSVRLGKLQNGISYTVGVAAVDKSGNASSIRKAFVQVPTGTGEPTISTDGTTIGTDGTTILGKSGCGCHLAGGDRGALPWGAILVLGLASWRRCRRQGWSSRRPAGSRMRFPPSSVGNFHRHNPFVDHQHRPGRGRFVVSLDLFDQVAGNLGAQVLRDHVVTIDRAAALDGSSGRRCDGSCAPM
jgi:hypothetical protein